MMQADVGVKTYTEIFEELCPYYLAIGMTMDEYWDAAPHLARWYRQAHKMRVEQKNQELWLQGLYVFNAFGVVLANAFPKKGATEHKYLEKPIDLFPKPGEPTQEEIMETRNSVVNTLNRFAKAFKAKQAAKAKPNPTETEG